MIRKMNMFEIGMQIRDRRKSLNMTQADLAQQLGFHQAHVSRIEKGQHELTIKQIKKIEQVLKFSLKTSEESSATHWFGMDTLYQISSLVERTDFSGALSLIHKARRAEFFLIPENESRLIYWEGRSVYGLHQYKEAFGIFQNLLSHHYVQNDETFRAMIYVRLASCAEDLQEYDLALQHFDTASTLRQKIPSLEHNEEFMYLLLYGIGTTYAYTGSLEKAKPYLERASTYTENFLIGPVRRHAYTLFTRGTVLGLSGDHESALKIFYEAKQQFELIKDMSGILCCKNNIAYCYKCLGKTAESEEMYKEVVTLAKRYPKKVNPELRDELLKEGYEL